MMSLIFTILFTVLIACIVGIILVLIGGATITLGWLIMIAFKIFAINVAIGFTVWLIRKILK